MTTLSPLPLIHFVFGERESAGGVHRTPSRRDVGSTPISALSGSVASYLFHFMLTCDILMTRNRDAGRPWQAHCGRGAKDHPAASGCWLDRDLHWVGVEVVGALERCLLVDVAAVPARPCNSQAAEAHRVGCPWRCLLGG